MTDLEKMNLCILAGLAYDAVEEYTGHEQPCRLEKAIADTANLLSALNRIRELSDKSGKPDKTNNNKGETI